jgi:hypothetical protein
MECPFCRVDASKEGHMEYIIEESDILAPYYGKLVDWGRSPLSWHQHADKVADKAILIPVGKGTPRIDL